MYNRKKKFDSRNPAARAMNSRRGQVQDRRVAEEQITVNDMMNKAEDLAHVTAPERTVITDVIMTKAELDMVQRRARDLFETKVKRHWRTLSHWLEYAKWEAQQGEKEKARNIYERALEAKHNTKAVVWREYAEFEANTGKIETARAVWQRALQQLPQQDDLWLKSIATEYAAHNHTNIRDLFHQWIRFDPGVHAWKLFIQFEVDVMKDVDSARGLLSQLVEKYNSVEAWTFYAEMERTKLYNTDSNRAKRVIETALEALPDPTSGTSLRVALAAIHEEDKNYEAARETYRNALAVVPNAMVPVVMAPYSRLERLHGSASQIDFLTFARCRTMYQTRVDSDPTDYVAWASLYLVAKNEGDEAKQLQLLRDATLTPPDASMAPHLDAEHLWAPYINLHLLLAQKEQSATNTNKSGGIAAARAVLRKLLDQLPHIEFDTSAVWIAAAELEIASADVTAARAILGEAIGRCPRQRVFSRYVELERSVGDVDRERKLCEVQVERFPQQSGSWLQYSSLETRLEEPERADAILQAALQQELRGGRQSRMRVWKALISLKLQHADVEGAIKVFEQLIAELQHRLKTLTFELPKDVKTAQPPASPLLRQVLSQMAKLMIRTAQRNENTDGTKKDSDRARNWFRDDIQKQRNVKDTTLEKVMLNEWRHFEEHHGDETTRRAVDESAEAPDKQRRKLFRKVAERKAQ